MNGTGPRIGNKSDVVDIKGSIQQWDASLRKKSELKLAQHYNQ